MDGFTSIELEFCRTVTDKLLNHNLCMDFREPVPLDYVPNYTKVIAHPMDLGTVSKKLKNGEYKSSAAWKADIMLIWDNCMKFNGSDDPLYKISEFMKEKSMKMTRVIPKTEADLWYVKVSKASNKVCKLIQAAPSSVMPKLQKGPLRSHK